MMIQRREFEFQASDEERLAASSDLGACDDAIADLKLALKTQRQELMASLKTERQKAEFFRRTALKGIVFRTVDCEVQFNHDEKTVSLMRLDNGEIVETRAMTAEELKNKPAE